MEKLISHTSQKEDGKRHSALSPAMNGDDQMKYEV